jgi:hypothetical protein
VDVELENTVMFGYRTLLQMFGAMGVLPLPPEISRGSLRADRRRTPRALQTAINGQFWKRMSYVLSCVASETHLPRVQPHMATDKQSVRTREEARKKVLRSRIRALPLFQSERLISFQSWNGIHLKVGVSGQAVDQELDAETDRLCSG